MGRYNLIDEPWIKVVDKETSESKMVGLKELFKNANKYLCIYGDMRIQDFAILRLSLAILHTVFSRYNVKGETYDEISVDDMMRQVEDVDEEDYEEHKENLLKTWTDLWNMGEFPNILFDYLDKWYDHFYLYDDKYPFYQFTPEVINKAKPSKQVSIDGKIGILLGKTFNTKIQESGNKTSIFSYVNINKDFLSNDKIARFLIGIQNVFGVADKITYKTKEKEKQKTSAGWLSEIGGIYFQSDSLFKTMLLNLVLFNPNADDSTNYCIEKPIWEIEQCQLIESLKKEEPILSKAELYTSPARALYIDKNQKEDSPLKGILVKFPRIDIQNNFTEAMTLYKYSNSKEYKNTYTLRKHKQAESLWRNFGLLTNYSETSDSVISPGAVSWFLLINSHLEKKNVSIVGVGIIDDGNSCSKRIVNEIYDVIDINVSILNDTLKDGWIDRINIIISKIKKMIDRHYSLFLKCVLAIKDINKSEYCEKELSKIYFEIDKPFKEKLASINDNDKKDNVEEELLSLARKIIMKNAYKIVKKANLSDYLSVERNKNNTKKKEKYNIIQALSQLDYNLRNI